MCWINVAGEITVKHDEDYQRSVSAEFMLFLICAIHHEVCLVIVMCCADCERLCFPAVTDSCLQLTEKTVWRLCDCMQLVVSLRGNSQPACSLYWCFVCSIIFQPLSMSVLCISMLFATDWWGIFCIVPHIMWTAIISTLHAFSDITQCCDGLVQAQWNGIRVARCVNGDLIIDMSQTAISCQQRTIGCSAISAWLWLMCRRTHKSERGHTWC